MSRGINAEGIAVMDMVVDGGCKKVVGRCDSVEVSGKVEIEILHGDSLRIAAACGAALNSEAGTKRGFPERNYNLFAQLVECIRKTDTGGRLAFPGRCRIDRCHKNKPAVLF